MTVIVCEHFNIIFGHDFVFRSKEAGEVGVDVDGLCMLHKFLIENWAGIDHSRHRWRNLEAADAGGLRARKRR